MCAIEERAEDGKGRAAQQVFLPTPIVLLLLALDDVGGIWLRWTIRADRTQRRDRRGRCAAVDDLIPHRRRERTVEQCGNTERERDHARERAEVEVRAEHGVPRKVETFTPTLEREHADDHEDGEHRDGMRTVSISSPSGDAHDRLVVRGPCSSRNHRSLPAVLQNL
jgi:hypothetical protein